MKRLCIQERPQFCKFEGHKINGRIIIISDLSEYRSHFLPESVRDGARSENLGG